MLRFIGAFLFLLAAFPAPATAQGDGISVIRDEEIEQTLKTFARPIFEEAGLSPASVRFVLIDKNDLNAFVAGGQNIFFNTGLILETQNPEELLGVIAHETGHISSGHLFRTQEAIEDLTVQAMLANIIGLAAAAGARSGDVGMAVGTAGHEMAMRMMMRHSRVQESSADQAGVRFLEGARLPLSGFLSFMEKLSAQELLPESQQAEYVRTHPLTRDRVDFLENTVNTSKNKNKGDVPAEWRLLHNRMKAKLEGYLFPDRALTSKKNDLDAQYAKSIALYRKGRTDNALEKLAPVITAEPENPYLYELKGQILMESGRVSDAVPAYARAVKLAPASGLTRAAYGHALLESPVETNTRRKEAIQQLKRSLDTEPKQPRTHRLLAIAYGKEGNDGLSRLHLAEEALMQNKNDIAEKEANLAKEALPPGSPGQQRARDIVDVAAKKKDKK